MPARAKLMEQTAALTCSMLVLVLGVCVGSPSFSRRLVCWKAILKCHGEPECHYAYEQYLYACASVISGDRQKCPSHCISSLLQLNLTRSGPALEDCDCALDPLCRRTQRAIEPCLPRTRAMGCTEARRQCEAEPSCSSAMKDYLFYCRELFGGQRCSDGCRSVIAHMRSNPRAQQLDACVCDGAERNICEYIRVSMKTLCVDSADRFAGSGFSDAEDSDDEDCLDAEDYRAAENSSASRSCEPVLHVLHVLTSILLLNKFI